MLGTEHVQYKLCFVIISLLAEGCGEKQDSFSRSDSGPKEGTDTFIRDRDRNPSG